MIGTPQQIRAFQATLEATAHSLEELVPLLRSEQEALSSGDAQRLDQVVTDKQHLLDALRHSLSARDQLLKTLQLPAAPQGCIDFLDGNKAPATVRCIWDRILDLTRELAQLNDRNGQLASAGERQTRQALAILTGRAAQNDTYARTKRRGNQMDSHSLGHV